VPRRLVDVPPLDPDEAAARRVFRLRGQGINGDRMALNRVDTTVVKGTTEVWEITNSDGTPHSFHVHDVQFQVLSVAGREPPPELRGWKDTIYLRPQEPVEIAMRFTDYADPDTPYMYHCHVLFHEDHGMMGQFVVVEPGQLPGSPGAGHHHGD
jgi:FtsP/CotA-like multicopper oxidase with cupredoxin domain